MHFVSVQTLHHYNQSEEGYYDTITNIAEELFGD